MIVYCFVLNAIRDGIFTRKLEKLKQFAAADMVRRNSMVLSNGWGNK
jgi:hypothetical protein